MLVKCLLLLRCRRRSPAFPSCAKLSEDPLCRLNLTQNPEAIILWSGGDHPLSKWQGFVINWNLKMRNWMPGLVCGLFAADNMANSEPNSHVPWQPNVLLHMPVSCFFFNRYSRIVQEGLPPPCKWTCDYAAFIKDLSRSDRLYKHLMKIFTEAFKNDTFRRWTRL